MKINNHRRFDFDNDRSNCELKHPVCKISDFSKRILIRNDKESLKRNRKSNRALH